MTRSVYPVDGLAKALVYQPDTGLLVWQVARGRCAKGSVAGMSRGKDGCLTLKFDGQLLRAHVVAWLLAGNEIPEGKSVEHINGDVTDNRLNNLRLSRIYVPITVDLLHDLFAYNTDTGALTLRRDYGDRLAGDTNTIAHGDGYRLVTVEGKNCLVHRVVWAIVHGRWLDPSTHIDHINGCRYDNRIANLRLVTRAENMQNMHVGSNGPIAGVTFDESRGKWSAKIGVNGKTINLGRFSTEEEGRAAYLAAKRKYHAPNVVAGTITPLTPQEAAQ